MSEGKLEKAVTTAKGVVGVYLMLISITFLLHFLGVIVVSTTSIQAFLVHFALGFLLVKGALQS